VPASSRERMPCIPAADRAVCVHAASERGAERSWEFQGDGYAMMPS